MIMRETFGGALLSQVKCLVCKGESNKTDEIMDISLDLPGSSSVADALACFFQPEILEGANKYSCERYLFNGTNEVTCIVGFFTNYMFGMQKPFRTL